MIGLFVAPLTRILTLDVYNGFTTEDHCRLAKKALANDPTLLDRMIVGNRPIEEVVDEL
jgi:hypothetical protein